MPEILTESFCERCGTRYTFEAVAPKTRPLAKLKIVSKGLKNYVLSDETSLDEAFADARSDEQRALSAQQLDAFHKAFSFCMSCRQYTCGNCWNEVEGRCLTCAPHLGHEILPGPFPIVDSRTADRGGEGPGGNGSSPVGPEPAAMIAASAWPTVDLRPTAETPPPDAIPAPTVDGVQVAAIEATRGADELTPPSVDERAAVAAATTTSLLGRFRPGRGHEPAPGAADAAVAAASGPSEAAAPGGADAGPLAADAAIVGAAAAGAAVVGMAGADAAVAEVVAPAGEAGAAEPVADAGLTPTELAEISAAALAARALRDESGRRTDTGSSSSRIEPKVRGGREAEADIAPKVAAEAAVIVDAAAEKAETAESGEVAAAQPEAPPAAGTPVEAQAWSMVAPEPATPSVAAPQAGSDGAASPTPAPSIDRAPQPQWPPAPARSDAPQWPPSPAGGQGDLRWPVSAMSDPRPAAGAPAFAPPPTGSDALWAASSRDVLSRPGSGVQACVSCGLPLSATARFCRRCGSRQG